MGCFARNTRVSHVDGVIEWWNALPSVTMPSFFDAFFPYESASARYSGLNGSDDRLSDPETYGESFSRRQFLAKQIPSTS